MITVNRLALSILVLSCRPLFCSCRSWTDIKLIQDVNPKDNLGLAALAKTDPLYQNTPAPTQASTLTLTFSQTPAPTTTTPTLPITPPTTTSTIIQSTNAPTSNFFQALSIPLTPAPTNVPSPSPTQAPSTALPTPAPSTALPTSAPTSFMQPDAYPWNPPSVNASAWYYNYDTRATALFGPGYPSMTGKNKKIVMVYKNNGWANVFTATDPRSYWIEFTKNGFGAWKGALDNRDPLRNMCDRVGQQSPIDLQESGAKCEEHHEVRSRPGDFRIMGQSVIKQILPNKLRLLYKRRPCLNMTNPVCEEPDPPHGDFPNGWGGFADVLHTDFKIPSEHTIEGKRFDAEMQIFHLHVGRARLVVQGVLIEVQEYGHNYYFEEALQAFEWQYDYDQSLCAAQKRRERQLVTQVHRVLGINSSSPHLDYETWGDFSTVLDSPDLKNVSRKMKIGSRSGIWDPYHEMLIPSIHFWRYDGSLTEPPCGEWVSWFISDQNMIISLDQFERMKRVLFTHLDRNCQGTSVHFEESVARPVQDTGDRPVSKCTPEDFGPDRPGEWGLS